MMTDKRSCLINISASLLTLTGMFIIQPRREREKIFATCLTMISTVLSCILNLLRKKNETVLTIKLEYRLYIIDTSCENSCNLRNWISSLCIQPSFMSYFLREKVICWVLLISQTALFLLEQTCIIEAVLMLLFSFEDLETPRLPGTTPISLSCISFRFWKIGGAGTSIQKRERRWSWRGVNLKFSSTARRISTVSEGETPLLLLHLGYVRIWSFLHLNLYRSCWYLHQPLKEVKALDQHHNIMILFEKSLLFCVFVSRISVFASLNWFQTKWQGRENIDKNIATNVTLCFNWVCAIIDTSRLVHSGHRRAPTGQSNAASSHSRLIQELL